MRYFKKSYYSHLGSFVLTLYLCDYVRLVCCWNADIKPNSLSIVQHNDSRIQKFTPHSDDNVHDVFKILRIETDHVIIGAKNKAYNISLNTLEEVKDRRVSWSPEESDKDRCSKTESPETCENFIRLFVPVGIDTTYICGTYAFERKCATYNFTDDTLTNIKSWHVLPHDPNAEYTVTYTDGYIFSNANISRNRFPNIVRSNHLNSDTIWTTGSQHDRAVLNKPRFVKSFKYDDKIYFFFRESDYKGINSFSSVARVCKRDSGGSPNDLIEQDNIFTSYFKSRLKCSRPGVLPFYFDEIAAVSDVGQSNFTANNVDKRDVVYAVFNTPTHAVSASAVCLYQMSDIAESFEGNFKKNTADECDMSEITAPKGKRLYECTSNSSNIQSTTVTFIRGHPIMARTVSTSGDNPVLVITGVNYRFTSVAVDWRVLATDDRYYDVIFVGTNDGHVLKILNHGSKISVGENNLIEKMRVFPDSRTITRLHVYRQKDVDAKLIIESYNQILSVPLQRCHLRTTCSSCVALMDPYCSWVYTKGCVVSEPSETPKALQDIHTGIHVLCDDATKDTQRDTTGAKLSSQPTVIPNVLSIVLAVCVAFTLGYCCQMRPTKEETVIKIPDPLTLFADEEFDTILPMTRVESSQISFKSRLQARSKQHKASNSVSTSESTGDYDRTISQRLTGSSHVTQPPSAPGSLQRCSQISPQPRFQSPIERDIKRSSLRKRTDSSQKNSRCISKLNSKSSYKRRDTKTSLSTKPTSSSQRTHPSSVLSSYIGSVESGHRTSSKYCKRRDINTSVSVKPTDSSQLSKKRGNNSRTSAQRSHKTNSRANSSI